MVMDWFSKVEKFVTDSFIKANNTGDLKHFERTVYWLQKLKPDADEALQIAAFAHDTERAFKDEKSITSDAGFTNKDHLNYHQETGAKIIADFLKNQHAPLELIERVKELISKHEVGGTADENILKDADSISYFENQIPFFLEVKVKSVGKDKVREKFGWMFSRISSSRAKQLAEPMYLKAIKDLQ
jgi:hypothetical protein